ncbi:MAG: CoA-binding protein [Betaproteobacteria bacterium]|nr:CoA-binding protein [Betaproteobacteria bacterium]
MTLARLLEPRSVALVGASADPKKISGMMVEFLRKSGFAGRVYPINPRYEAINDWPCYASVDALPETVDVVVVAVPVAIAFEALEQAARRGVPFVVLMTGGFGEGTSGEEGERWRDRLVALCAETGMRVVGPNTVGMVNFRGRLPLTFADWYGRDTGQRGGVAILTHSGSVGGLIFSSLQVNKVGVDYWIATGNEATLETADFIDYLSADAGIHTIFCFMEGVMDGRKFMAAAEKARRAGKHVVVLKAGSSAASQRSTRAHTIKSSSTADVYRGVFEQLGVVQVHSLEEMTYCVKLLHTTGGKARGNVGIVSASGGACSLIADHVVDSGLALPELDATIQAELANFIPVYGSTKNPVDFSADVVSRRQILDGTFATLAGDTVIDTWIVFGRPVIDRYPAEIAAFAKATGKSVIASSGVALRPETEAALQQDGVPVLDDPELCMRALKAICRAAGADAGSSDDWSGVRARPRGAQLATELANGLLARHDVPALTAHAGHSSATARTGIVVSIGNDSDFGPVFSLGRGGLSAAGAGHRIARALPLSDRALAKAVAAFNAVDECATASDNRLFPVARAACALYAAEPGVAQITVELAIEPDGAALVRAAMFGTSATP